MVKFPTLGELLGFSSSVHEEKNNGKAIMVKAAQRVARDNQILVFFMIL
jgi:hypothetical protein